MRISRAHELSLNIGEIAAQHALLLAARQYAEDTSFLIFAARGFTLHFDYYGYTTIIASTPRLVFRGIALHTYREIFLPRCDYARDIIDARRTEMPRKMRQHRDGDDDFSSRYQRRQRRRCAFPAAIRARQISMRAHSIAKCLSQRSGILMPYWPMPHEYRAKVSTAEARTGHDDVCLSRHFSFLATLPGRAIRLPVGSLSEARYRLISRHYHADNTGSRLTRFALQDYATSSRRSPNSHNADSARTKNSQEKGRSRAITSDAARTPRRWASTHTHAGHYRHLRLTTSLYRANTTQRIQACFAIALHGNTMALV